jgi:hypothetical protein
MLILRWHSTNLSRFFQQRTRLAANESEGCAIRMVALDHDLDKSLARVNLSSPFRCFCV